MTTDAPSIAKPALTPTESRLLRALTERGRGRWVTRPDLLLRVWNVVDLDGESERHMLRVTIYRLRQQLRGTDMRIETRRGGFYRLLEGPAEEGA